VLSRILKRWSGSTATVLVCATSILALGWSIPSFAATNQAVDPGGGGVTLNASGLLTVNGVPLALVKQARDLSGSVLPGGSNVMAGQTIYFALYVDNVTGVTASDIRISDLLNESEFTYVPGTLETTVVPTGSNDAAIWAGTWTALTDALGGPDDIASVADSGGPPGPDRITVGGVSGQANQTLNLPAGSLRAIRLRVRVN